MPTAGSFLGYVKSIRKSVVAFVVVLVLGLFGMGLLGAVVYYSASPVLMLLFPTADEWTGDWWWPAMIGSGMLWSFGFLIAGVVNRYLERRHAADQDRGAGNVADAAVVQRSKLLRGAIYAGILWVWGLVVWTIVLANAPH